MIKCTNCSWNGSRGDLKLDMNYSITDLTRWNKCPRCNTSISVPVSLTTITPQHRGSVVSIDTTLKSSQKIGFATFAAHNDPTFIHLGRILDFSITEKRLFIF